MIRPCQLFGGVPALAGTGTITGESRLKPGLQHGSVDGRWKRFVHDANAKGIGTVRYPRLVAKDADSAAKLKNRTLTNLYNERPAWLANARRRWDEAYGWPADMSNNELLAGWIASTDPD